MAYIYKIINDINNKIYVGKTEFAINKRWDEHKNDCLKQSKRSRPLYRAMMKYGIDHFHIELIEETNRPEEREVFWINYYDTYRHGYNATHGGDGKRLLDYDAISAAYQCNKNISKVAKQFDCSTDQVSKILKEMNVTVRSSSLASIESNATKIIMLDKETMKEIREFNSIYEAAKHVLPNDDFDSNLKGAAGHISDVCKGRRKTAYGYCWKSKGATSKNKINHSIKVDQYDKELNYIQTFDSYGEAAKYLIANGADLDVKHLSASIGQVANGKRKTCCGYIWKKNNDVG